KEVVELYTSDLYASITPDVKRLRRFEKINLKPGETRKVTFNLTKDDLSFIGMDNKAVTENGEFKIQIGNLVKNFNYKK
ncbi:MAG: fibronectin type III-like domain-contianing protein, partial [Pyrinomonadaceae bacterium]|nr:fibronectin type III-like domain-contianing protein [Sphingobacteriaceae bacterium]